MTDASWIGFSHVRTEGTILSNPESIVHVLACPVYVF